MRSYDKDRELELELSKENDKLILQINGPLYKEKDNEIKLFTNLIKYVCNDKNHIEYYQKLEDEAEDGFDTEEYEEYKRRFEYLAFNIFDDFKQELNLMDLLDKFFAEEDDADKSERLYFQRWNQ